MAATVFGNLVDGQGLQSGVGSQGITVTCLAYSRRTGNYDIGSCPRHICGAQKEKIFSGGIHNLIMQSTNPINTHIMSPRNNTIVSQRHVNVN